VRAIVGFSFYTEIMKTIFDIDKSGLGQIKEEFFIGVDSYDKDALAYCLIRKSGEERTIVLCNTRRNEADFNQEVENLAMYFNAEIIREK